MAKKKEKSVDKHISHQRTWTPPWYNIWSTTNRSFSTVILIKKKRWEIKIYCQWDWIIHHRDNIIKSLNFVCLYAYNSPNNLAESHIIVSLQLPSWTRHQANHVSDDDGDVVDDDDDMSNFFQIIIFFTTSEKVKSVQYLNY